MLRAVQHMKPPGQSVREYWDALKMGDELPEILQKGEHSDPDAISPSEDWCTGASADVVAERLDPAKPLPSLAASSADSPDRYRSL